MDMIYNKEEPKEQRHNDEPEIAFNKIINSPEFDDSDLENYEDDYLLENDSVV